MAAKRTKKSPSKRHPLIAVALGLLIAALAALALLSDGQFLGRSPAGSKPSDLPQTEVVHEGDHDRDQIDEASRDQLRELLRAESSGE